MEHFYVKFGNPSCSSFGDIVWKKQTDTQTNGGENSTPATAIGVRKNNRLLKHKHNTSNTRHFTVFLPQSNCAAEDATESNIFSKHDCNIRRAIAELKFTVSLSEFWLNWNNTLLLAQSISRHQTHIYCIRIKTQIENLRYRACSA